MAHSSSALNPPEPSHSASTRTIHHWKIFQFSYVLFIYLHFFYGLAHTGPPKKNNSHKSLITKTHKKNYRMRMKTMASAAWEPSRWGKDMQCGRGAPRWSPERSSSSYNSFSSPQRFSSPISCLSLLSFSLSIESLYAFAQRNAGTETFRNDGNGTTSTTIWNAHPHLRLYYTSFTTTVTLQVIAIL